MYSFDLILNHGKSIVSLFLILFFLYIYSVFSLFRFVFLGWAIISVPSTQLLIGMANKEP